MLGFNGENTMEKQQEITKQMEKCICKLHTSGGNGTGFFAKIPYKLSKINGVVCIFTACSDEISITFCPIKLIILYLSF